VRSPWVKELKKMGMEWKKITGGKVTLKVYAGGIAGSEKDMVRKIRLNMLSGALFTNMGIININPDAYVLSLPFVLESESELDFVSGKIFPLLDENIEKKGFKVLVWSKAGWVNFYTKKPITYPNDLKQYKISIEPGVVALEQALKISGYRMIPINLKDLMIALDSGMVDAFFLSPLLAASGQYFALAPHMCPLKIAPVVGGLVVSKKVWSRVPEQYREKMVNMAKQMADALYKKTLGLEKEAIEEMKKNGLKVNLLPPDAREKWKTEARRDLDALVGKAFSKEIYDKLNQFLNQFRTSNESK
jgi:TRAP-type C4-dicarboxylate transport system substrate-binding protein